MQTADSGSAASTTLSLHGDHAPNAARHVAWFFVVTLVITWGLQLPAVLVTNGLLDVQLEQVMPFMGLSAFGPLFGAVLVLMRTEGRASVAALFRSLGNWRVPLFTLVLAPFVSGAIYVAGRAVYGLFADDGGPFVYPPFKAEQWIGLVVFSFGEEMGWRAYALPRLQKRHGPLFASVVIGLVWAVWHAPMMHIQGVNDVVTVVLLVPFFVAGSVVFTWWTNRALGSALVAFLLHTGAQLSNPHQTLGATHVPLAIHTAAYVVVALGIVIAWRRSARVA